MKKSLLILAISGLMTTAQAHDVWVSAPTTLPENTVLKADLSYGHHYPQAETIAADRVHIFKPLSVLDEQNRAQDMKLVGDNYHYASQKPLKAGTYRVAATYQPTFWTENPQGKWQQTNLTQTPDATYCEQTQMFGKAIVQVGNSENIAAMSQPVGQELEIVPLANPNTLKSKQLLPIQVLYQGKPLAGAMVMATSDVIARIDPTAMHEHRDINGYAAKTDKNGKTNFLPLVDGMWKVKVIHKTAFEDQKVCQHKALYATLIVPVGHTMEQGEHAVHHHTH
ncbi:DUF4198 domain-containing protein [Neisseriaceae bacterium B1]